MFSWLLDLIVSVYLSYSYNCGLAPLFITSVRRSSLGSYVQVFGIFTRPTAQFTLWVQLPLLIIILIFLIFLNSHLREFSFLLLDSLLSSSSSLLFPLCASKRFSFRLVENFKVTKNNGYTMPFPTWRKKCFTDLLYFICLWLYEHLFHEDLVKWGPVVSSWDWQTDGDG